MFPGSITDSIDIHMLEEQQWPQHGPLWYARGDAGVLGIDAIAQDLLAC